MIAYTQLTGHCQDEEGNDFSSSIPGDGSESALPKIQIASLQKLFRQIFN